MERSLAGDLQSLPDGSSVVINGWAQEIRSLKNLVFVVVRDSTGQIQATFKRDNFPDMDTLSNLSRESVISVTGKLNLKSKSKTGMEIEATGISILNVSESPLPLGIIDPVEADFETRLNNRFLDLRKPVKASIFRIKSSMLWGIRDYLHRENFVEVQTPKIVAAATEGGADLFPVKYFEREAYLNQSPQLYKEILISSGIDRVFEVGPAFRAEEHNTVRHLNEFTSVDIEMAFSDHNAAMTMLENSVKSGIENVLKSNSRDLEILGLKVEVPEVPFPRISYEECRQIASSNGVEIPFGEDLSVEALKFIGDKFHDFYFIIDWPSSLRPFYTMPKKDDPRYTNSYDLQYREKEITSGAQRVHNPDILIKRFMEKGLKAENFEFYIKAFRYGMPPHAGWGLGLERLLMILLDLPNIREGTLFPRDRTRIVP